MKRIGVLSLLAIGLAFSCGTQPDAARPDPALTPPPAAAPVEPAVEPVKEPPPAEPAPVPEPEPLPPAAFDPETITEEKISATRTDVQALIAELNSIIRARNYNAWTTHLAASYLETISSREFLDQRSNEIYERDKILDSNLGRDPRLTRKKILRTAKDYFDAIVVPSRSNVRMDEIDFLSENRVRAYAWNNRMQRLEILYTLEMIDTRWKIVSND